MVLSRLWAVGLLAVLGGASSVAAAGEVDSSKAADQAANLRDSYQLQPGDVIDVSVWKETDLQREVLIRPDGGFTFPLAGEVDARGKSVENVRKILVERLQKYVPSPVVTVAVKAISGNRVYVLGKVLRAGDFPLGSSLDVMQAISL